jgi:hypothetical protein
MAFHSAPHSAVNTALREGGLVRKWVCVRMGKLMSIVESDIVSDRRDICISLAELFHQTMWIQSETNDRKLNIE